MSAAIWPAIMGVRLTMMSEYLDTIHGATEDIRHCAYKLSEMSTAFYIVGNNTMARKLEIMADKFMAAQEEINNAVSRELTDRCKEAEQAAFNTVSACLAVIKDDR